MLILVVVIASVSIATIWSGLSKDSGDKIGTAASVVDRGTPVYIAGDGFMVPLVQALAKDYNKDTPTLFITAGEMNQTSAITFLYDKGTDLVMFNGTLPKLDPNYQAVRIGNSSNQSIYLIRKDTDIVTKSFVEYARSPLSKQVFNKSGFTSITDL
jgi:ABC-type phosphate transport system substrate-binding protein